MEAERTDGLSAERDAREMNLRVSSVQKAEKEVGKAIKSIEEVEGELSKQKTAAKELKDASKTVSTNRQKVCMYVCMYVYRRVFWSCLVGPLD